MKKVNVKRLTLDQLKAYAKELEREVRAIEKQKACVENKLAEANSWIEWRQHEIDGYYYAHRLVRSPHSLSGFVVERHKVFIK